MMAPLTDILQPWQRRYFDAFRREGALISCTSRQIGKSFIGAFCADYDAVVNGAAWTLVSTGQRAADDLFRKAVKIARFFEASTRGTPLHFDWSHTASEIVFSTGGSITSLPNNPDGLRGKSSSLLIDEMAFIQNAEECWQACIPFLTSPYGAKKKLQIFSTPGGKSGKFYELWTSSPYHKTKVTLLDAVGEGLQVDVPALRQTVLDDDVWAQEYMCEFLDNDSALYSYELLRGATYGHLPEGCTTGKTAIGIDIGRTHDLTAIAILRRNGPHGSWYLDHVETLKGQEFKAQLDYILKLVASLGKPGITVDATGIGANLAEDLHRKHPTQTEAFQFSNESKNDLFATLKKDLSTGALWLPNDQSVLDDLHKIRRIVGPSGTISYRAGRDDSGHADIATAIALANRATRPKPQVWMPVAA